MEIIPSIDLRGGKVVRLYQGDYARETVFGDDPVTVALRWQEAGSPRLHAVDLDGARTGVPANLEAIAAIVQALDVPVQAGGGVRTLETAKALLAAGVQRIIFGTAAVRNPALVTKACVELGPEAVIVGVDARDGMVAVQGWTEASDAGVEELVRRMAGEGVKRFIFTDVSVDGTLEGPNVEAVRALAQLEGVAVISSGGVGAMEHLERLAGTGVEGVILGSSLYKGTIDLREAVRRFGNRS